MSLGRCPLCGTSQQTEIEKAGGAGRGCDGTREGGWRSAHAIAVRSFPTPALRPRARACLPLRIAAAEGMRSAQINNLLTLSLQENHVGRLSMEK